MLVSMSPDCCVLKQMGLGKMFTPHGNLGAYNVGHFEHFEKNPSYCTPRMGLEKDLYDENGVKAHLPLPPDSTFLPAKYPLEPLKNFAMFRIKIHNHLKTWH